MTNKTALITGASQGLGRELATALAARGWTLILDARGEAKLTALEAELTATGTSAVATIAGDVADPMHRAALRDAVETAGGLDLLVNNASTLGATPLPRLEHLTSDQLTQIFAVNVIAPVLLTQLLLPALRTAGGIVLDVSSDAAVEAYPAWGGYGASKAALDHATAVLAVEEPGIAAYAVDPGDMRTAMHAAAFSGEDISDRPLPSTVVPALLHLIDTRPASGRYRAADLQPAGAVT